MTQTPPARRARRDGRVRMDNSADIRAPSVDTQMHGKLRRRAPCAAHMLPIGLHFDQIIRTNIDLRHSRGRYQNTILGETDRDIPISAGDEAALPQSLTDGDDLTPNVARARHSRHPVSR